MKKVIIIFLLIPFYAQALELGKNTDVFNNEVENIRSKADKKAMDNEYLQNNLKRIKLKSKIAREVQECMKNGGCYDEKVDVQSMSEAPPLSESSTNDSTAPNPNVVNPGEIEFANNELRLKMFAPKYELVGLEGKWALFKIQDSTIKKIKGEKLPDGNMISKVTEQEVVLRDSNGNHKTLRLEW